MADVESVIARPPAVAVAPVGGALAELIRTHDWAQSSLGHPDSWSAALRTTVGMMLAAQAQIVLFWGPEFVALYNDAYAPTIGDKHPRALGRPASESWTELWDDLEPLLSGVRETGETFSAKDRPFYIERNDGQGETVYFDVSYSAVPEADGSVGGVLCIVSETTERVLDERRIRESEAALRAERDRTRAVLDGMAEGFGLLDADFRVIDINAEALRMEERPRDAIIGKTHWNAWPGTEDSAVGRQLKRAMAERVPVTLDHRYTWPDGHEAWLEMRAYPSGDGLAVFWRDVTQRHRAEDALRESEEFNRRILQSSADCIKVLTLDGNLEFMSEGGKWVMEVDDFDTIRNAHWPDFWPEHEQAQALAALDTARSGKTGRFQGFATTAKDSPRWWDVAVSPISGPGGAPEKLLSVSRDITALVEAERALRIEEARYRLLFDSVESGFCVVEVALDEAQTDYRVVEANPAFFRQTGFPEDIRDRWLREAAPELEDVWFETYGRIARTGEPERFEQGSQALGRWFDVYAFRIGAPEERRVAILFNDISARRNAEIALQESEARFRNMADHAPVMMWVTDPDGHCTYLNRGWYAFTGQSEGEAAGFGWLDAVHPDDRGWSGDLFLASNAKREPFRLEYRLRHRDGSYRWAIDAASPRFDADGAYLGYVGSVIDIDKRRVAEEARRLSEERYRALVQALGTVVWTTRADGWVEDMPQWRALTGQTVEQCSGHGWLDAIHPDDRAPTDKAWRAAVTAREPVDVEYRIHNADGSYRWYNSRGTPLLNAAGEVREWIGVCIDIEGRKTAESALRHLNETLERQVEERTAERRQADAMYRAYFENTAEALFVVSVEPDDGFVIEDLNPAHQASIGLPLAEVRGRRIDEVLPPDLAEQVSAHYRHVIATGVVHQYQEIFELNGGPTFWDTVLVPVRDAAGRIVRLIGASRDLTRQLAAEEQLRQSQKMEAMGQLTGGVAHDFNNLLTPIVGSLDMLQRKALGSEREQRLIAGAMQSAERAKVLVQRLLAFARRQPLQPSAVDVGRVVEGMADLLGSTTGPQVRVVVDIADGLPPANADPNQLEMALLNLGVNARDAMPDGGTLRISATHDSVTQPRDHLRRGHYVRLSVADSGIGMDEATLARAVEPFFSTKGVGKGTGLGLSMAHGLAAQLGGALTIQSRQGVGTNVELWLPISNAAAEQADAVPTAATKPVGAGIALLVDDEELVRISTADMLADLGYEVVEADSAERALALIGEGLRPTVLVTDHLMAGMNGTDLARTAREALPGLQVLIVSGYAETEGIAPDLPRLTKPFRNDELAASLAGLTGPDTTA